LPERITWPKTAVDIGMVVANYHNQRAFYEDTLGLRHLGDIPLPGGVVHILECGDTFLKLYQLESATPTPPSAFGAQLGWAYVTLNVTSIERLVDHLTNSGVPILVPVSDFVAPIPLLPPAGTVRAKVCMVADAEGNAIELLERY
jgi:catechol 2,3-dioxygenase-like lactoylglutathione lyase family enzyme